MPENDEYPGKKPVKRLVSIRVDHEDVTLVKEISARLRARDSSLYRYALKKTLRELAPLAEQSRNGRGLVPALIQHAAGISAHFGIGPDRLDAIVNPPGTPSSELVDYEDLELLILAEQSPHLLRMRLAEVLGRPVSSSQARALLEDVLMEKYIFDSDSGG